MERPRISAIVTKDSGRASRMGHCRATPKPIWLVYMGGVVMASVRYHAAGLLMVRIIDKVWFGGDEFFFGPLNRICPRPHFFSKFFYYLVALTSKRGID